MQNDEIVLHMIDLQLDDMAHEGAEYDEVMERTIRRDYGRWLALRRAVRGLNDDMITERTRLTPLQVRLLELGLFDPARDTVPEGAWRALAVALEDDQRDFARVSAIIRLAIGRAEPADTQEVAAVADDLSVIESELQFPPEVSQVLVALTNGAATGLAVQDDIAARTGQKGAITLGTIASVLAYLDQYGMAKQEPAPDPAISRQPIFRLTPDGMQAAVEAVRVEERRVALEEQRTCEEEQRERAEQQQQLYQEAKQRLKNTILAFQSSP